MSTAPLRTLHQQARQAMSAGNLSQALPLLQQAALKTTAREGDYVPVLRDMHEALVRLGNLRGALTVAWYLGDARSEMALLDRVPPVDQARTLQAWHQRAPEERQALDNVRRAADIYEPAGMIAHAAICRERARQYEAARTLWSRLAQALSQTNQRYEAGLARFNLARTSKETGDAGAARAATVASVHMLEEAADHYERIGQRERAFDCYQVLIAIGKQSGEFEHVLEGYVNVVRILREDNLRYYALHSYEDALQAAESHREFAAGATLAQEMASYAQGEGLSGVANHAIKQQATLWQRVAQAAVERGAPAEIAENAMLAAIVAYARQGQFQEVGKIYGALGELDIEEARKQHYARATLRYHGVDNEAVAAATLPSHMPEDAAFPLVWHDDLVEWEQRGSAAAAAGDIVLDAQSWSEVTRRRAMIARLQALDVEGAQARPNEAVLAQLAELLGQVELYTILSPLEKLYQSPAPRVRLAVVQALERFMYKRTFVTVRAALHDPDAGVRQRAYKTLEQLRFPHAFDPLSRVFRESEDPGARAAAVRAIARIDTDEAAELLLGVFQHEGQAERGAALDELKRARGQMFLHRARSAMPTLRPDVQTQLREVFHARGEML
jgi:hypothetical protein